MTLTQQSTTSHPLVIHKALLPDIYINEMAAEPPW